MIVEDQYLIADEMRRFVDLLGGTVIGPARDLADARRLLESGAPELAVLDINLGGEQVWSVAQELRDRRVPLIFASGYGQKDLDPRFRSELHLDKPVTAKALAAAVQRLPLPLIREL